MGLLGFPRLTRWSKLYLASLLVLIAVTIVPRNTYGGADMALYLLGVPAIPMASVALFMSGALLFSVERDDWVVTVWACLVLWAAAVLQAHLVQGIAHAISSRLCRRVRAGY